jgi:DNA helicase-2/ATP-dependent DNA helicase PcrA
MLAKDKRKITVVGDDYQSIYAFRGSDIRNILDFDKDFNDAEIIKLEQNYRSTKKIIEAANQIIQHNVNQRHKVLFTENPEGEKIKVYSGMNEYNEAAFVAQEIQSLKMQGIDYKDIAVLFRNNQKSAMIETLLNNEGVPNKVVSGMSFFQRREIKDVLYYLRFLLSTSDPLYLREVINIPKRGVGDASVDKMIDAADGKSFLDILNNPEGLKRVNEKAKDGIREFNKIIKKSLLRLENDSVSNVVQNLLDELDLINKHYFNEEKAKRRERQDNLNQFIVLIKEKEKQNPNITLSEFIEEMTLFPVEESDDSGYVQLMTMHASKGLEFKVVFLVGMDKETFPSKRANTEFELEEERRVAYVAFTRAKELLYLTFPEEIYVRGTSGFKEVKANQPSPYLKEFDRKLMSVITQRYI